MNQSVRPTDTEKITINMGPVDLGQIDLLVQEGFFANRTDFIRSAIRSQLATHQETVRRITLRKDVVMGVQEYTASDLERVRVAGEKLVIRALGLVRFAHDVPADLVEVTVESFEVLGAVQATPAVTAVLARCGANRSWQP